MSCYQRSGGWGYTSVRAAWQVRVAQAIRCRREKLLNLRCQQRVTLCYRSLTNYVRFAVTNASVICHAFAAYIFLRVLIKSTCTFFRLHATFCNVHSEVGYELVLGTTWFGYELVVGTRWPGYELVLGTSWSGCELVLGTSWLGYELAWYDLVRVRVDWKPIQQFTV